MKDSRFREIQAIVERYDRIADNAQFLSKLEENGVTANDLKGYTRERDKRDRIARQARRR